jgi:fibronectin type 3 domain-containing protein
MKKLLSFLLVACFSATLFAQTIVSTEPSNRNIILEEFTGKTCQYCPDGHKRAQQLMAQYPGRFFAINVHQGGYASGTPNYTTPYGDALANQAGIPGYPAGTVNRQVFQGVPLMTPTNFAYDRSRWASCANIGMAEPSCLNIAASGVINKTTRHLSLLVEVYYTGNATQSTNKLTVAMMQNEILGPQTGGSTWYPEMMVGGLYRHMHMLRDYVNGTQWGMEVSPTTAGSFWTHTFEYDIPQHFNNIDVVLDDLEFVVFVCENNQKIITGVEAIIVDETSPLNVLATQSSENPLDINITWSPPISPVQGYNLYRDGVKMNTIPLSPSTNSFSDVAPDLGITYCYVVTAIIDGEEYESAPSCVLTFVEIPTPINVTAKQLRGKNMLICWDAPETPYPIKYNVYRHTLLRTPQPVSETCLEDEGAAYIQYSFEVESALNELRSPKTELVYVTLINVGTPTNLVAEQVSIYSKDILLTWNGSSNAVGYNIYRNGTLVNAEPVTSLAYTDVALENNVEYTYEVYGVANNGGESENGAIAHITLVSIVPCNVQAQNNGSDVSVTWDAIPMDIEGYNIYRNDVKLNTELVTATEYADIISDNGDYCYTITAVMDGHESEKSESACINMVVGICEKDKDALFSIYPNPVSGILNISTEAIITDCRIYNMKGQLVYLNKLGVKEIATDSWSSGIYIIRITTEKGVAEKRFLKN